MKSMKLAISFLTSLMIAGSLATSVQASNAMERGIVEYNAGRYEKAAGLFGQAEPTNFNDPTLHYYLGNAYAKTGHEADAMKQYRLALALEPQGKLAEYCQQALQFLQHKTTAGAKGSSTASTVGGTTLSESANNQAPQVLYIVCGCPLCGRLDMIVTDLQKRFGDKVAFTRFTVGSGDKKNEAIVKQYKAEQPCPTILYFGVDGALAARQSGTIPEPDIWRQVSSLARANPGIAVVPTSDKNTDKLISAIEAEAEAKLADARRSLEQNLASIQSQTQRDMDDGPRGRYGLPYWYSSQVTADNARRVKQAQEDFERRKKEIYEYANSRIQNISPGAPKFGQSGNSSSIIPGF